MSVLQSTRALGHVSVRHFRLLLATLLSCMAIAGCESAEESAPPPSEPEAVAAPEPVVAEPAAPNLDEILAAQSEAAQARYQYRHPAETLAFFGIETGMAVGEVLPGNAGWYSQILAPWLGTEGELMALNYPIEVWPNFSFVDDDFLASMKTWTTTWPAAAATWNKTQTPLSAFNFGAIDETRAGSLDAVLFFRALHNLARFDMVHLDVAISETFTLLKPGGIVGVVQHQAREDRDDEWANGSAGYLKKSFVIAKFAEHGFVLEAESPINENPKDQATTGDIVWRLPPSARADDPDNADAMAIGESNRMTLRFIKPAKAAAES